MANSTILKGCDRCGNPNVAPNSYYCQKCLDYYWQKQAKFNDYLKSIGINI